MSSPEQSSVQPQERVLSYQEARQKLHAVVDSGDQPEVHQNTNSRGERIFDGSFSSIEQSVYKTGAKHIYGIDSLTGKKRHISHDELLEAHGYKDLTAKEKEIRKNARLAQEGVIAAVPVGMQSQDGAQNTNIVAEVPDVAPVGVESISQEEKYVAFLQVEHGLTYEEALSQYQQLHTPDTDSHIDATIDSNKFEQPTRSNIDDVSQEERDIATIMVENGKSYDEAVEAYRAMHVSDLDATPDHQSVDSDEQSQENGSHIEHPLLKNPVLYLSARFNTFLAKRHENRKEELAARTDEEKAKILEKRKVAKTVAKVTGLVALLGAGMWLTKYGSSLTELITGGGDAVSGDIDTTVFNPNEHFAHNGAMPGVEIAPPPEVAPLQDMLSPEHIADFNIPSGTGGEALMNRLGIDTSIWYTNEAEMAQLFPGETYWMDDGHLGLSKPGQLSESFMTYLAQKGGILATS